MAIQLIVTHEFHGHPKGMVITDPKEVEMHLKDRPHHFVKVFVPDAPVIAEREVAKDDAFSH